MKLTCLAPTICAAISIVGAGSPAWGQVSPEAQAVLSQAETFTKSLKTVVGDMQSTVTAAGMPGTMRVRLWAEMPDKALTMMEGPGSAVAIYNVGNQQTTYIGKSKKYGTMQLPAPGAPAIIRDFVGGGLSAEGVFADKSGKRQITLVGKETVAGKATNHLRITVPGGASGDIWIADGAEPLPVYARFSQTQPPISAEIYYRWIANGPIDPSAFQFTPPAGATPMNAPGQNGKKTP